MFFYQDKPIKVLNADKVIATKNYITNFLRNYSLGLENSSEEFKKLQQTRWLYGSENYCNPIKIDWSPTPENYFKFGMAFMGGKPIQLVNEVQPTPHKSYENVLLALDKRSRS